MSATPYCFDDKKQGCLDERDKPWDMLFPYLNKNNEKRRMLTMLLILVLDESMSGSFPKTSKLGGLPNYTYEPRNQCHK